MEIHDADLVAAALDIINRKYKGDAQLLDLRRSKYWDFIVQIKNQRTACIKLAKSLLASELTCERFLGISLLGQICNPVESGQEAEADKIIGWLSGMVKAETAVCCLALLASALGSPYRSSAQPALLELSHSSHDEIRWAATKSLGSTGCEYESDKLVSRLIELSEDKDADIRNWATFHLRSLDDNSERVHNALAARLKDRHFDTKSEAICGLASKSDPRGIEPLKKRLSGNRIGDLDIESAGIYAKPELLQYLKGWKTPRYLLEWARKRCSPRINIKNSIDDEWLDDGWYLNVKAGVRRPIKYTEWDGSGSPWKD